MEKKFLGSLSSQQSIFGNLIMQIRTKWPILENICFNANFFKNIIRQLFADESHLVVKITVLYCVRSNFVLVT